MTGMMSTAAAQANRRQNVDYAGLASMLSAMRDDIKAEIMAEIRAELVAQNAAVQMIAGAINRVTQPVAPIVNVPPAQITVEPADVQVNAPVSVSPAGVTVLPAPAGGGQRTITIHRDARGAIDGATVKEG